MKQYTIDHGIRVGNNMTATLHGDGPIRLGDILHYPNGRKISIVGIGSGRYPKETKEVLVSGEIDSNQNTVFVD